MTDDNPRVLLFWEDRPTLDGRLIAPQAVGWSDERFPVMRKSRDDEGETGSTLYGYGFDVRREEDGSVTCRVEPPLAESEALAVELDQVMFRNLSEDGVVSHTLVVEGARLRAAAVVDRALSSWPE